MFGAVRRRHGDERGRGDGEDDRRRGERVAIGRALVREPDVFLLDEPLSNLDAKLRVQMRAELLELHAELSTTTVYVTHDQTEAMTLGDRVAVVDDGRVRQVATPQRLYDFPADRFVAEFLGDPATNVFPVELASDGETVSHETFRLSLPTHPGVSLAEHAGSVVDFGVRPEDLRVDPDDPLATATVNVTEPLGESLLLHCRLGETELRVKTAPRQSVSAGDTISLGVDPDRLHLFDPDDGTAVYHSTPEGDADGRSRAVTGASEPS